MKAVSLSINQITEGVDFSALDAALKIATAKVKGLGLDQLDSVTLTFVIGPTEVEFTAENLPGDPATTEGEE